MSAAILLALAGCTEPTGPNAELVRSSGEFVSLRALASRVDVGRAMQAFRHQFPAGEMGACFGAAQAIEASDF